MKNFLIISTIFFASSSSAVFAVGTGSGGSTGGCTQDTWLCGNWSACSIQGMQTRNCALTFDCPGVVTPKPAESQSCTSDCTQDTWNCTTWGLCLDTGVRVRTCTMAADCINVVTPKPSETESCVPIKPTSSFNPNQNADNDNGSSAGDVLAPGGCRADSWRCDGWSEQCDEEGRQTRSCSLIYDCPGMNTPSPAVNRPCEVLQCGNKTDLRDRVMCRLSLSSAALAQELTVQYLPEECRFISDQKAQQACVAQYRSYKPCWNVAVGVERFACAQTALNLKSTPAEDIRSCAASGKPETICKQQTRDKVFSMIKFRFYDLEERAEELIEQGVSKEIIGDFVVFITNSKQAFNQATSDDQRRQVILDVRTGWQKFVTTVTSAQ